MHKGCIDLYGAIYLVNKVNLMRRVEALETAEATLDRAGYEVSRRCVVRTSCFDFATRKENKLVFIKILSNISDISRGDAFGIRSIARCFSGIALLVTDLNGKEMLRDDTVYSRYGVRVVTFKTLKDGVRGAFPLVEAVRGGYFVRAEGKKIRDQRHKLGLSIGKLAGMVGVSRQTLYGYERDMTRASISAAYRLEEILGVPIVTTIDIFGPHQRTLHISNPLSIDPDQWRIEDRFLQFILHKLAQFDFAVSPVKRAPFDFTAHCRKSEIMIIGGVFRAKERYATERVEEIVSLSRVVEAQPLLVGRQKIETPEDVTFLDREELAKMEDRKALASSF